MKIAVNPKLQKNFDSIPNDMRPQSHQRWWFKPFIRTVTFEDFKSTDEEFRSNWYATWPEGIRYDVRCLDGGTWDRTTNYGSFATLVQAESVALTIAEAYKDRRKIMG